MTAVVETSRPLRGPLRKRDSHLWSRDPNDWYVEPEWVSARLFRAVKFEGGIWDPAAGMGRIVQSARAAGHATLGTDLIERGYGSGGVSFLKVHDRAMPNIVSNPPFGIAESFVTHALHVALVKVAMLLPANWVQGDKRSRWLERTPLVRVLFITPRPSMPPGAALLAGQRPGNGTTDYAWFIWSRGHAGPAEISWLRREA